MRTLILAAGTKQVVARPIRQAEATRLAAALPVTAAVNYDGTVHLWANRPTTTAEEVRALGAFIGRTDAPVSWHKAVAR